MQKFLVISPHAHEECTHVIKQTLAIGYLTHFYWGCKSGDHTGYAIIDADNEKEALLSIPTVIRSKGRAIGIVQFDPKVVEKW
ncbi:MAG: hypothetical protein IPM56_01375 [Ignavibacteriales bacterium]|nr:MAG: hypothetical protein IPM56_01375 [Ignavibacteriales bacterium]